MTRRPPSTVLAFDHVSLSYPLSRSMFGKQRLQVLDNVSFRLESGHTVGILGRNGAGKSSLLKLMAGVLQPDSGKIIRPEPELRIALLTMQLGFQPNLSGRENAIQGCLLMGLNRRQAEAMLPDIISFAGLSDHIEEAVASFSSGMRARLGFSVAYHTRADILLIDEALGVGDHEFKLKSRDAILDAIASDRTAVLVSHDEAFLKEQCEQILWFENTRLVTSGNPAEVLELYHDYNHMVLQLANDLGVDVEEVRKHPNARDPIDRLNRLRRNLKRSRSEQSPGTTEGVSYYHPSRREKLSQLCTQECGGTVWIEQTRCLASGEDHEVRQLYRDYEDVLFNLSRTTKVNANDLRQSPLIASLIKLLDDVTRHQKSGLDHE